MALEGANLIGANPVLNTGNSVNYYLKDIERQRQQRAAEAQALQEELSTVKMDGIRDADKQDFYKGYEDWRTATQEAYKEKDFKRKAELQSQAAQKKLELQDLVGRSKQYNKEYTDIKGKFLDNRFRDQFKDDAVTAVQQADRLPMKDPRFIKDFTTLARQVDVSKVDDEFRQLDTEILKGAKEGAPVIAGQLKAGNKVLNDVVYTKTGDAKEQAFKYGLAYDAKKDVKAFVQQTYADLFSKYPEDQAKAMAIQDLVSKRPLETVRRTTSTYDSNWEEDQAMKRRRLALAEQANSRARVKFEERNKNEDTQTLYRQQLVNDMLSGVPGSGEKVKGITKSSGKYGSETFDILVKGNNIQFTVPDQIGVNTKGESVVKKAGRTVTINKNDPAAPTALNALISEVTGENISDSKFNSGNASGKIKGSTASKSSSSKKTVPMSRVKSLVGKPGYEGYTEKELVDYYKSQGYNIQ